MVSTLIGALIVGAIVGPLARLALPGRQNITAVMTVVLGALGSLAGGWIFKALSGRSDTPGIDWIALFIGIVVAAILIVVYGSVTGKRQV